jgi:hypothetical protein
MVVVFFEKRFHMMTSTSKSLFVKIHICMTWNDVCFICSIAIYTHTASTLSHPTCFPPSALNSNNYNNAVGTFNNTQTQVIFGRILLLLVAFASMASLRKHCFTLQSGVTS